MAKKKVRGRPLKDEGASELISFRLTSELIKKIEARAKGKVDETGAQISVPGYARRLLVELLTEK